MEKKEYTAQSKISETADGILMIEELDADILGAAGTTPSVEAARIVIIGVGGGGGNALNNIISNATFKTYSESDNIVTVAMNTDYAALTKSRAKKKVLLGNTVTRGLGAGNKPEMGAKAAEATEAVISQIVSGADMVFVAAGMGGGTGTGAAPVIADLARKSGALTVGVVTMPFEFEGKVRKKNADEGLAKLQDMVDTLLLIDNDKILAASGQGDRVDMRGGFLMVDDVLRQAVVGVINIIQSISYINIDFADIRTILEESHRASMGVGYAQGEGALMKAFKAATNNSMMVFPGGGATGALYYVESNRPLEMSSIHEAAKELQKMCAPDAQVVWGQGQKDFGTDMTQTSDYDFSKNRGDDDVDEQLKVQVTVFVSGFKPEQIRRDRTVAATAPRAERTEAAVREEAPRSALSGFSLSSNDLLSNTFGTDASFDTPALFRRNREE